jgi:tetratricopeptide (TPR) repeat protein
MKELNSFIQSPYNDLAAFHLANWYYDNQQYAAALSFYLRVTEVSKNDLLIYESLLKSGLCFEKQGNRTFYAKGMYLHAISVLQMKPEAYFLLSRLYERNKDWQESYSMAEIGLFMYKFEVDELTSVEYPGRYGFLFEKSVVGWYMGRIEESKKLSLQLLEMDIDEEYKTAVLNNINFLFNKK